ncbi:hypothetical protein cand_036280 [Cryptosporidium andersoni]|uniref:Transmembrane protein n=1 Tax=Cryptosporidium andersoni TaxID=117008 RepID=A0A1J4MV81_9CRYT|nr:hypothetical protein cand_036280 [Cryptosporidium andersoni]
MFFKVKPSEQFPTAPASPVLIPSEESSVPDVALEEVRKVLYFGFCGFLSIAVISLAVLQVNVNTICDRNLDEVNAVSALLSLVMATVCSILSFFPIQTAAITRAFKYGEMPLYEKSHMCQWAGITALILLPLFLVAQDVGGFISIAESNTCKYTAPGLFIGTICVISLQLLVMSIMVAALNSARVMDILSSLPSLNISLITEWLKWENLKSFIDGILKLPLVIRDLTIKIFERIRNLVSLQNLHSTFEWFFTSIKEKFVNSFAKLKNFWEIYTEWLKNIQEKIHNALSTIKEKIKVFFQSGKDMGIKAFDACKLFLIKLKNRMSGR